jgi:hypothetical protein
MVIDKNKRTCVLVLDRLRWPGAVFLGFLFAGHLAGARQKEQGDLKARTVRAEKYEIPGPNGTPAAMLYQTGAGQARLVFLGEHGEPRLSVGSGPRGSPAIIMFDRNSKQKLNIGFDPKDEMPQLGLFDEQGNETISLRVMKDVGPQIAIGRAGLGRVTLGLSKDGEPHVLLWSKNDLPRFGLDLVNGAPTVTFLDESMVVRASWHLTADGSPVFSLRDARARERLWIGTDKTERPFIRMIDPDNNTVKDLH